MGIGFVLYGKTEWVKDVNAVKGVEISYPIVADPTRTVAAQWGMLDHAEVGEKDSKGLPVTVRSVFIIGPDKRLKLEFTCELLVAASIGKHCTVL